MKTCAGCARVIEGGAVLRAGEAYCSFECALGSVPDRTHFNSAGSALATLPRMNRKPNLSRDALAITFLDRFEQ
jgi:hypothetical protein